MKALLIVDLQNDFCPGGAVPVPYADEVVPVVNNLMDHFPFVIASRDWHPVESVHFDNWAPHCINGTEGAEYHSALLADKINLELFKGTENKDDGYSVFEATNCDFAKELEQEKVDELYITGIATESCVKQSVLDALNKGFKTYVIKDAVRSHEKRVGDGDSALKEMEKAGATVLDADAAADKFGYSKS